VQQYQLANITSAGLIPMAEASFASFMHVSQSCTEGAAIRSSRSRAVQADVDPISGLAWPVAYARGPCEPAAGHAGGVCMLL